MLPVKQSLSEDHGPEIGTFEAAYELASMDTFVGGMTRNIVLDEMDGPTAKKMTPEELNNKYKDVEVPFNKPMSELAAFHLNEEGKKRRELQSIIAEGPKGTFYNQAVNIGASLVAHALDPVEFGAGAFAGIGFRGAGALIKGSKAAANFSAIAKTGDALTTGSFGAEVVEGIVGNIAIEPFMAAQMSRAQVDYGIEDAFISTVGGALAMPVLKKAFKSVLGLPDSTVGIAVKNSIGQAQEGFRPTPEVHAKTYNDIAYKNPPEGAPMGSVRAGYKFEPMDPKLNGEKVFYMTGTSINESKTIGDFLGDGAYMTDNPNFANNIAAHPMDDSISEVFEVRLDKTNLVDIGGPIDPEIKARIPEALRESPTIKSALDKMDDGDREAFVKTMKESGYDGLVHSDVDRGHNAVHLFPESINKIQEQGRFKPEVKAVPSLDAKEVEAIQAKVRSRENELGFDPELDREFQEFELPPELKSMEATRVEADLEDELKRMDGLDKEGYLSEDSRELLESIKQSKLERNNRLEVIKDFASCLLSGV